MSDLHIEILEELMTIDDAGNGQDEAIAAIIDIVREYYGYKDSDITMIGSAHESDIRADERERCIAKAGERKLIHILNEGPARSDEINWFNAGIDTVIEAIKAE